MRIALAWIIGIASGLAIYGSSTFIVNAFGIPTWIDFDETITIVRGSGRYSYEEDADGASTIVGSAISGLAILIGGRIGLSVFEGKLDANLSASGKISFKCWLLGLLTFFTLACLLTLAHQSTSIIPDFIFNLLSFGAAIATASFYYKRYEAAVRDLKNN